MCANKKIDEVEMRRLWESSSGGVRVLESPTSPVLIFLVMRNNKMRNPMD